MVKSLTVNSLPQELSDLYSQMPQRSYSNVKVVGDGILQFSSFAHYDKVYRQLEEDCENWDEIFYKRYSYLDEDSLLNFEEQIGYNEFLPIIIFEESLGVKNRMLFDYQYAAMQSWMDNGLRGPSPIDPIFNIEYDQALFNIHHEVCIGDTIYQYRLDAIVIIPLSEFENWRKDRYKSTEDLNGLYKLKKDTVLDHNTLSDMPSYKDFRITDNDEDNKVTETDFPGILSSRDKSVWSFVGKRVINASHVTTCKLVNYTIKKIKPNGDVVYRKVRRNGSIISKQVFSIKAYHFFTLILTFGIRWMVLAQLTICQQIKTGRR